MKVVAGAIDRRSSSTTAGAAPPPRSAQNRSGSLSALHVRMVPSGSTTSALTSRSQVRPSCRESTPTPPPRVMPAMPTVGQLPEGSALSAPTAA